MITTRLKKAWQVLRGRDVKNYDAGSVNRLTYDWPTTIMSPTSVLRSSLANMRVRSRNLDMNNDYAHNFFSMVGTNVAGPDGIGMQSKAKYPDGTLDTWANTRVEQQWELFNRKGNFDVTGQLSGKAADRLFITTEARDGEVLIRWIDGWDNEFNCAVQFLEADHLDETLNISRLPNGNSIRMGKEFDPCFRPVAYHLLAEHPGDGFWRFGNRQYVRVPADQIIHPFIMERFNQPRGVPWVHSAMTRLNNIGAYEEAEIIGARIGASTMGIWERDEDADPTVSPGEDAKDSDGTPIMEMEPGIFAKSPKGYHFKPFDPNRPAGNFAPFMKAALRGIASGMLVSYNALANDLEGVNFSSMRIGALTERDCWKVIQAWMVENYKQEIFRRWLRMAILLGKIGKVPMDKIEKFARPKWQPRSWDWIDPEKDINAAISEYELGTISLTEICAKKGRDLEGVMHERAQEIKMIRDIGKQYGIDLEQYLKPVNAPAAPAAPKKEPPQEDQNDADKKDQEGKSDGE